MAAIRNVFLWEASPSWVSLRDEKMGASMAGTAAVAKAFLKTGSGLSSCLFGAGVTVAAGSDARVLTLGQVSLAAAGAVAAPWLEDMLLTGQLSLPFAASAIAACGSVPLPGARESSAFPAASAARRKADAIGSASGLETGCQGYSFALTGFAVGGAGVYSIRVASAVPSAAACSSSCLREDADVAA